MENPIDRKDTIFRVISHLGKLESERLTQRHVRIILGMDMAKSITHILVFEPRPDIYERAKVQGAQKKCVSHREKIRKSTHGSE